MASLRYLLAASCLLSAGVAFADFPPDRHITLYNPEASSYLCYEENESGKGHHLVEEYSAKPSCTWQLGVIEPRPGSPYIYMILVEPVPYHHPEALTVSYDDPNYRTRLQISTLPGNNYSSLWDINWLDAHQHMGFLWQSTYWMAHPTNYYLTYDQSLSSLPYVAATQNEMAMYHLNPAYQLFIIKDVHSS